jgi:uncharacterized membrane protein YgcG
MKTTVRLVLSGVVVSLVIGLTAVASWAQEGYSHARIVRLSFTEGVVTVQRPDAAEWAMAPTNTPIQEGFKLSTAESGYAEVEFENSSTARLGQLSLLEFTQLALTPSGSKVNRMTLHEGYATFTVIPEGGDFYEVKAGSAALTPHDRCRFRVDYDQGMVQVKVFKGSVEILSPEGTGTLGQNTVLLIRPGADEPFEISQGITKDAWDEWVEERENRMEVAHSHAAPYSTSIPDLLYGWMDLTSYGSWYSLPGYGWGWVPMVDYGWAPFTMGRWCWYSGFGWAWISSEPWGWLPYHYGTWIYEPGLGWVWLPGSFGYWSPGVVNWYRGPGWVGWAPRSPLPGGRQTNCPGGRGCVTAVDPNTIRQGLPVHPNRLGGDFGDGQLVERPDLGPDRLGMLPGSPQAQAGSFRNAQGTDGHGQPGRLAPGATPAGRGSAGSIVYDAGERRYVNEPAARETPAAETQATMPGVAAHTGRPGPRANYPAPAVADSLAAPTGLEERPAAPRGGARPTWQESRAVEDSDVSPPARTRRESARSDESSSSRDSSSRPAPSASPRSDSGSRSSGMSSGSPRSDHGGSFSGGRGSASPSSGDRSSGGSGSSSHSSGSSGGSSHSSGSSGGNHSSGGTSGSHSSSGPKH